MFGDLMGMMGKLRETREKVKAAKDRLSHVTIEEKSADGRLRVTISANRVIKEVSVDDSLLEDREELEDYLVLTLNKAIEQAGEIHDAELAAAAKEGLPDFPGMDALFKP